jgi:hypothetical protein
MRVKNRRVEQSGTLQDASEQSPVLPVREDCSQDCSQDGSLIPPPVTMIAPLTDPGSWTAGR